MLEVWNSFIFEKMEVEILPSKEGYWTDIEISAGTGNVSELEDKDKSQDGGPSSLQPAL